MRIRFAHRGDRASPTYGDRQARLMAELEQAFKEAAGRLLEKLDVAEIL
jgi:hypothetical protein